MGKSKARIFRKGINDQITKMTRCDAVAKVAQYLNEGDNNSARDLITMFGLSAEEILEAGASYESVIALKTFLKNKMIKFLKIFIDRTIFWFKAARLYSAPITF